MAKSYTTGSMANGTARSSRCLVSRINAPSRSWAAAGPPVEHESHAAAGHPAQHPEAMEIPAELRADGWIRVSV
jgi:hypothetical protein